MAILIKESCKNKNFCETRKIFCNIQDYIIRKLQDNFSDFNFLELITDKNNLDIIFYKFINWLLIDKKYGIISCTNNKELILCIKKITSWFEEFIKNNCIIDKLLISDIKSFYFDFYNLSSLLASSMENSSCTMVASYLSIAASDIYTVFSNEFNGLTICPSYDIYQSIISFYKAHSYPLNDDTQFHIEQVNKLIKLISCHAYIKE